MPAAHRVWRHFSCVLASDAYHKLRSLIWQACGVCLLLVSTSRCRSLLLPDIACCLQALQDAGHSSFQTLPAALCPATVHQNINNPSLHVLCISTESPVSCLIPTVQGHRLKAFYLLHWSHMLIQQPCAVTPRLIERKCINSVQVYF